MDAARINQIIYAGRGKASLRIGYPFNFYRPASAATPFPGSYATLNVGLNAADNIYRRPNLYGKPIWFADFDASTAQTGDYFQSGDASQTYFVAAKQSLLPVVVIECNRTITIQRAVEPADNVVGAVGYSGLCQGAGESTAALGATTPWPASILIGGAGRRNIATSLPGGTPLQSAWQILLPPSVPISITEGDRVFDDLGNIYSTSGAELTDMGWRLHATQLHA